MAGLGGAAAAGAASGYMMLGILWAVAYSLVQRLDPQAFGVRPGDLVPTGNKVRMLVILEQVAGTLFAAILIARLAGIYPAKRDGDRPSA